MEEGVNRLPCSTSLVLLEATAQLSGATASTEPHQVFCASLSSCVFAPTVLGSAFQRSRPAATHRHPTSPSLSDSLLSISPISLSLSLSRLSAPQERATEHKQTGKEGTGRKRLNRPEHAETYGD